MISRTIFSKQQLCQSYYMDAPYGRWQSAWRKSLMAVAQECYEPYWTNPGSNIPQNSSYTITYLPSLKPFKSVEQGHCWRSKGELISDILQWTPSHRWAGVGHPARTYLQQLCTNSGCSLEDLLNAMDNRDEWRGRVREIHAHSTTW